MDTFYLQQSLWLYLWLLLSICNYLIYFIKFILIFYLFKKSIGFDHENPKNKNKKSLKNQQVLLVFFFKKSNQIKIDRFELVANFIYIYIYIKSTCFSLNILFFKSLLFIKILCFFSQTFKIYLYRWVYAIIYLIYFGGPLFYRKQLDLTIKKKPLKNWQVLLAYFF